MKINVINSINEISESDWQNLNRQTSLFSNYRFFHTLENSGSVSSKQGWQPHHLKLTSTNNTHGKHDIDAILPMYSKSHSWGEYVFDWAWADAYQQHNIPYYPKLVTTIPFTPVTSNKLLSNKFNINLLYPALIEHCNASNFNSWHILYCQNDAELNQAHSTQLLANVYQRNTVQFHWLNYGYQSFDDFLARFNARKRKNTKKERKTITEQGIEIRRLIGKNINQKELEFFYLTYQLTYLRRGHTPHLNYEFFQRIIQQFPDNVLLIIASHGSEDIACSWFFFDDENLYGRYWGCTKTYNNLHFELCYYQGIEFCIENNLALFHPGTQGEHKIQRGFEPKLTTSYHWIKHPAFRPAIKAYCLQEQQQMQHYLQHCQQRLPFKLND